MIGINSQIYSNTGAFQGMSFAIPIDVAIKIADQLLANGKVTRAHLGVESQVLTPALAEVFGLTSARGALVGDVEPDSPAQRAGLKAGDVIVAVDGKPVVYSFDLPLLISDTPPGARATLDIMRDRKRSRVEATLTEAKDDDEAASVERLPPALGLTLRPLTPIERMRAGFGGLVVLEAVGNAAKAGIQAGDILLAVTGKPVSTALQLRERLMGSTRVAILVQRGNSRRFLVLTIGGA